ncbi:MAG: GDP-mannose 4,6-dehydratase [Chloroflexi bacterium]|nr:GDP-mannose 4,6-dehydratase [Chloroflexota bacterium]
MRVLITGITGMAGSHLAEFALQQPDVEVFGTYRSRSRMDNLHDLERAGRLHVIEGVVDSAKTLARVARSGAVNLVEADLRDPWATARLAAALRPDRLFHLAAQSFVPLSFSAPAETVQINATMQINLFEAVRLADLAPLIQIAGSSEEYGLVLPDELPLRESNPLRPLSPYAVSKVTQELLAQQYYHSYGIRSVVTRGFNHTGPRRGPTFVTSSFARQIAEAEAGLRPPVVDHGDLSSRRDWCDVRDVVRGYWLALEHGAPGEVYNIGSGTGYRVGEVLDILCELATVPIERRVDPARMRPSDVPVLIADATKFRARTGWAPTIPFRQTLADLLDYWRARVHRRAEPASPGEGTR